MCLLSQGQHRIDASRNVRAQTAGGKTDDRWLRAMLAQSPGELARTRALEEAQTAHSNSIWQESCSLRTLTRDVSGCSREEVGRWSFTAAMRKSSTALKSLEENFYNWAKIEIPAQIDVKRRKAVTIYEQFLNRLQVHCT